MPETNIKEIKEAAKPKKVKEVIWPNTNTGGVMSMSIETRFANERHRLSEEYTEKWKQYRIKYIKSLILTRKEPRDVPEFYREFFNPIRRFYRIPLDTYEKLAKPIVVSLRSERDQLIFSLPDLNLSTSLNNILPDFFYCRALTMQEELDMVSQSESVCIVLLYSPIILTCTVET